MNLNDLLRGVDPRWHQAFLTFVETGEAEADFLEYLDNDPDAQKAVDEAFTAQAAAFEDFAQALKTAEPLSPDKAVREHHTATVSAAVASLLEGILQLPVDERRDVIAQAASTLVAVVTPERRKQLRAVVEDLKATVTKAQASVQAR